MVKILKTYIYDIIDITSENQKLKKKEEINPNDVDIDEQIIEEEDNGLNIIEDDDQDDDDDEQDVQNILINDYVEFDDDDKEETKILEKKTFNYLTKYERCFILGIRIQQIMNNSPIFIDIKILNNVNPFNIAYEELLQKKLPFKVKRKLPNGNVEIWDLEDLIII
jgi:DNA-directed RNA polymerase I, II, and III subunit RPABC2